MSALELRPFAISCQHSVSVKLNSKKDSNNSSKLHKEKERVSTSKLCRIRGRNWLDGSISCQVKVIKHSTIAKTNSSSYLLRQIKVS